MAVLLRLLTLLVLCACSRCDKYHPYRGNAVVPGPQPDPAERTAEYWTSAAHAAVRKRAKRSSGKTARNVVLFMGDGMSVPTLTAARALLGQREGKTGEEAELSWEAFPTAGLAKTYCVNEQIADSACTATAYLTGVKTNMGLLGLTAAVKRKDCEASLDPATHLESIAAWALADGRDVGIVTTARVTHASPGGAYARSAERDWENDAKVNEDGFETKQCPDIAHQLVHMKPAKNFKVVLGGGRSEFLSNKTYDEEGTQGNRHDNRNLIQEWIDDKKNRRTSFGYVWNREQLMKTSEELPEYLLGLFEGSHMRYHLEANETTEPTLAELTEVAIKSLKRNDKGFFLFVEGGRIDHAHHENFIHMALDETIEMSKATACAAEQLSEDDSLIVVTADHAHVMGFNGYMQRGSDILGISNQTDRNRVPYMTLSYTNGPGARPEVDGVRVDVTKDPNYREVRWRTHAEIPLEYETHGGDDVAVFARCPHHDMFTGLYEQNLIPHLMAYAGGFCPTKGASNDFGDLVN